MYKLAGISLSSFGFQAGKHTGSVTALSGFLDLPARIGKTFHNWGDENGVEPYVLAEEIAFGGRDLVLVGFIKGSDRQDSLFRIQSLRDFVDGFTDLVELESPYGTYDVKIGEIAAQHLSGGFISVTINMREPIVDIAESTENTAVTHASLKDFGAELISMKGQRYGRPETKPEHFTAFGKEGYQITKTVAPVLEIELFFRGESIEDFTSNIRSFGALLAREGTRIIQLPNDTIREFFVVDGMQLTSVIRNGSEYFGFVSFTAIEVDFGVGYSLYVEHENMNLFAELPPDPQYTFELDDNGYLIMNI